MEIYKNYHLNIQIPKTNESHIYKNIYIFFIDIC